MGINKIQFQKGLSMAEFMERYGTEENDRISFVLTEQLQIKRLEFLDIIKEESTALADTDEEVFDLDFTLMTGELARMLTDLIEALGGEVSNNR